MNRIQLKSVLVAMLLCCSQFISAQVSTVTKVVNGVTFVIHPIKSGDTYYSLSKLYSVSVADLQKANDNKALKVGEELLVPSGTGNLQQPVASSSTTTHKVAKGETISKIAKKYGVNVEDLKKANSLASNNIKVGQTLRIPNAMPSDQPTVVIVPEKKPLDTTKKTVSVPDNRPATQRPVLVPSTKVVLAETATEKELVGTAKLSGDNRLDPLRTFVLHPTLPKGSIIVVINENTGKMAYCRVVDNVKVTEMNNAEILISSAIAQKIGMPGDEGTVKIKYAVP